MAAGITGGVILQQFVTWLMDKHPERAPSQSEIARKAHSSQTLIYKLTTGFHQSPALDTYQRLTAAYPVEWREFLEAHPPIREELAKSYAWALGRSTVATPGPGNPRLAEAVQHLERIFGQGSEAEQSMILEALRSMASRVRAESPAAEVPRRRRRRA